MRRSLVATCLVLLMPLATARANPVIGEPAPLIELEQLLQAGDGAEATLDALRGHVVVLEFWATWCAPCVAAIPHMNELAEEFADRPVRFISITDEDAATVEPFLERRPIGAWVGLDTDRSVIDAYGIIGIPRTAIIGPDGRLLAMTYPTRVRSEHIEAALRGEAPEFPQPHQDQNEVRFQLGEDPADPEGMPKFLFRITIRPSAADVENSDTNYRIQGGGPGAYTEVGGSLRALIASSYDLPPERVIGHEGVLGQRATVAAKVPPEAADLLDGLVRAAIESSYGVTTREEMRDGEVIILGPPTRDTKALQPTVMSGGMMFNGVGNPIRAVNYPMDSLAGWLSRAVFPTRPVINETGLEGGYDFTIEWAPDEARDEGILRALEERLGLTVRIEERPLRYIVVEPK